MTEADVQQAAKLLLTAYSTGRAVAPLIESYPELSLAQAYEVQLEQVHHWTAEGRSVRGHKVGLTSAVMQRQLGVDQPDYGHLTDTMFHLESLPIDTGAFISPRVEPEIALVLKRDLTGPGVTAADAINAVDYVLPALEIIDSRVADWKISLIDTIADNASSGGVVLGSTPAALDRFDMRLTGCVLHQGGRIVGTGAGAAALGSPLNALVWLANTVGPLGITLAAGSVIMPGSITAAVPAEPGMSVTATFAGLGSVTAHFAQKESA